MPEGAGAPSTLHYITLTSSEPTELGETIAAAAAAGARATGLSRIGPLVEQPLSEVQEVFDTNVMGVLRVCQVRSGPGVQRGQAWPAPCTVPASCPGWRRHDVHKCMHAPNGCPGNFCNLASRYGVCFVG